MKYKLVFIALLLLAAALRLYHLGSFPPGFTWDEAAIGYNAYGILTVHRDEWLNRLPLTFKSFGDYKSPLLIYLVVPSIAVFGLTEFAVRLPVALSGIMLVVGSYFLARELMRARLLPIEKKYEDYFPLVVMGLTTVSPWALHFSTIAFESCVSAMLAVWGTIFFLKGLERGRYFILSGALYALSLYAYHSAKLVVPLTILFLVYLLRREWKTKIKDMLLFFGVCLLVGLPLLYVSVFGNANSRFFGSSILVSEGHLRPIPELVISLAGNFMAHFDPRYLVLGKEVTYRQSNMLDGILSPVEAVLVLVAIWGIVRDKNLRAAGFILVLIVISILPATLGADVPHANRALLGLPWYQLLAGVGFILLWKMSEKRKLTKPLFDIVVIAAAFSLLQHVNNDAKVYATSQALSEMQYGYRQAIEYVRSHESQVDRVYFTNVYGQAYIYLLFYKQMNPIDFRGGGLANYVITDHPWKDGAGTKRVYIVGGANDFPEQIQPEKVIYYPDGKVAFKIVKQ